MSVLDNENASGATWATVNLNTVPPPLGPPSDVVP